MTELRNLEIITESVFHFSIKWNGADHFLEQRGGTWLLDGQWIASCRIGWPEALARALRVVSDNPVGRRAQQAMDVHSL